MTRPQRIAPVADADLTEDQREILGGVAGSAANIFATLVRHPGLIRKWLPFGGKLLAGRLPARERELLILRTAVRCAADYEWGQHVRIGLASGLTQDEIDRVPDASSWDGFDAVLLQAVDDLHDDAVLSDATWAALAARYDERQLIEVTMVVGHYHMVGYTLNSLGVQREEGIPDLPR